MRIGYLGAGSWGFALACLLAAKGHDVVLWTARAEFATKLRQTKQHPKLPHFKAPENLRITANLEEALQGAEMLIESVTTMGIRPVFEQVLSLQSVTCPVVITSKGIEQNSGLLLPEVLLEVLGKQAKNQIGTLSGPSHAEEVVQELPTSIVSSSYDADLMHLIADVFGTPYFRVYPNADIHGVSFGGALKNIIAIACGLSDGLGFGDNTKAALMTRGLHEMRKLAALKGCNPETLNGLSGMGDLCVTCLSKLSRNYTFGHLIAEGLDAESAKEKIGMVVEGAYTCVSALQLGKRAQVPTPITQAVYSILYEGLSPKEAVRSLLQRAIKEERL